MLVYNNAGAQIAMTAGTKKEVSVHLYLISSLHD